MRRQAKILTASLLCAFVCANAQAADVLVSIKPIHSLVSAVMENSGAQPQLLVGGALSEHNYELKPSDARKIEAAKLIFWIGPNLETYLANPLHVLARDALVVPLGTAHGVHTLPARHGGIWGAADKDDGPAGAPDPHLWLDPQNAIAMTRAIAGALIAADPPREKLYAANSAREIASLENLDRTLRARLAALRGKRYIVFHDAYHYFEARYGLTPAGAVTVAPDRPVGPRRITDLRQAVLSGHARCIFREPQFPPRIVDTIASGTGVRTGILDPLGADIPPGPALYQTLLLNLANALTSCLAKP